MNSQYLILAWMAVDIGEITKYHMVYHINYKTQPVIEKSAKVSCKKDTCVSWLSAIFAVSKNWE